MLFSTSYSLLSVSAEHIEQGSAEARAVAAQTLNEVRDAMKINYFADRELIAEQAARYKAEHK